jgi:hypothetical protein
MDALKRSHFLHELTGKVWLSQNEAFEGLLGETVPTEENPLR